MLYVNIHSNINRKMLSLVISSYDCKTKITSSTSVYSPKANNLVQEEHYTECIRNTQTYESSEVYILSYRKKIKVKMDIL